MDAFWIIFLAMIGSCVGSFLNVVMYRLPRGESVVFPPSHCPRCGRKIKWYDNVPLVSWFALGGKCRFCKGSISPRYLLVEAACSVLAAGLFVWYYVLDAREGAGAFTQAWPTYTAHAALLCGLLACSLVDIDNWIVPLEVCWVVSVVGLICAAAAPHPWMPMVSPETAAASLGGGVGLAIGLVLLRYGFIRRSFIDATEPACPEPAGTDKTKPGKQDRPKSVAATTDSGVNPRLEVLRELLFLAPAIALALLGALLVARVAPARRGWLWLTTGPLGPNAIGLLSALFGYLIGGLWIWGIRILGTLGFGKEAMGLGDVHILAAVGAVTGWIVPSAAFFLAPVFGLLWALYLLVRRNQRELPYGPWLAVATFVILLFYDLLAELIGGHFEAVQIIFG